MRSLLPSPRSFSSLLLVLALGCGDSTSDEAGDDEAAGDSDSESETATSSSNPESGTQGNEANTSETDSNSSESGETLGTSESTDNAEDPLDTGTETEEPIDCLQLDEPTCMATDVCVPYLGMPYTMSIDGMICLDPPQFLGCLFAIDACLPATGTLCMGEQAFAVDSLCPPPEGFAACDPPVLEVLPCMG